MVGIEKLPLAGLQTNTLIANLCTLACVGPFGMMLLYGIPAAPPQWMVLALFNGISNIVQGHAMCDLYNDASNLIVVAYMLKNAKMLARLRYRYGRTIICYVLQMIADCVWWILLFGDGYDTYVCYRVILVAGTKCLIVFFCSFSLLVGVGDVHENCADVFDIVSHGQI